MTGSRQFILLYLALTLGSAPLFAQTAKPQPQEPPAAPTTRAETKSPAPPAPPAKGDTAKKSGDGGKDSPFDYRASEQISEDLPVSFPVDI